MKILGIDFGLKNIGLAFSDEGWVEPLGELVFKGYKKTAEQIKKICLQNKIEKIVIGLPEGRLKERIKIFAQFLEEKTGLPLTLQDETLTTTEAVKKMIEAQKPKRKRKKKKHQVAACLILQSYLEEREK